MTSVFNLLFDLFESVIGFLKEIPLTQNVSLFDFSLAILIMSIIVVAFVPIVQVGSTNYVNDTLKAERAEAREREAQALAEARAIEAQARQNERDSYDYYRAKRQRNEEYNKLYIKEKRKH